MDLQQFEFYELLGKGTFGEVYRAPNKSTGEAVSVKIVTMTHSKQSPQGGQIPGWKDEIEIMKRFNHPHSAKFYDSFEDSNKFYIVMEYFDGEDLF
jgi:serine/threonine protein kinase